MVYLLEDANVAQSVERILGKDEVHRFDPGRGLQRSMKIKGNLEKLILCETVYRIDAA